MAAVEIVVEKTAIAAANGDVVAIVPVPVAAQVVVDRRCEAVGDPATGLPIGGTGDNLKAAIAGETHEYTDMYPGMAKSARDEGFEGIADWFETLAKAERSHANRFQKALDGLDD